MYILYCIKCRYATLLTEQLSISIHKRSCNQLKCWNKKPWFKITEEILNAKVYFGCKCGALGFM